MSEQQPGRAARAALIAIGATLGGIGLLDLRTADLPIYLTFIAVSIAATLDPAEVFPGVRVRVSNLAISIGFVYVGGLPIIALGFFTEMALWGVRVIAPESVVRRVPQLRSFGARGPAFPGPDWIAQEATGAVGLAARWWIATAIAARLEPGAPVWASMMSIAVAELIGYQVWALIGSLSLFPDRPLLPRGRAERERRGVGTAAMTDMALVVLVLITPFVFLMLYGYAAAGLPAMAGWALAAVLAHRLFKRLADRRIQVEQQNEVLEVMSRELAHRERLSAIGKMSSVVSHQILQQLGVIGIYADLVRNTAPDGDGKAALARTRAHGAAIEGALEDVNRVLRDLLVFSRELRVNVYANPVSSLLREVVEACLPEAESAGVRIESRSPEDLIATFDKLKLRQALENIVRNALAASPPGGLVSIEARARGADLEITVEDQGPGVAESNRSAIFAPFFTTKEHGTGLGLAIAREFTVAHGGTLALEPAPSGRLARFVITIPGAVARVSESTAIA